MANWSTGENTEIKKASKRALKLLGRFISLKQQTDFKNKGYFVEKDKSGRVWSFTRGHYPITCDKQRICIDPERGAPDEDLILQGWLEVKGGRGEELLPSGTLTEEQFRGYLEDASDTYSYERGVASTVCYATTFCGPTNHGILHGVTE